MAQTVQIVPAYSFPHVATYINDYTVVADEETSSATSPVVTLLYTGPSSKGIDNTFIKLTDYTVAKTIFGQTDFSKYGQPLMTTLDLLNPDGIAGGATNVWFMRLMPENATYANVLISIGYKIDTAYTLISDTDDSEEVEYEDVVDSDGNVIIISQSTDSDGNTVVLSNATKTITRTVVVEDEDGNQYTYVETTIETYVKSTTIILTTEDNESYNVQLYVTGDTEYSDEDSDEDETIVTKTYTLDSTSSTYVIKGEAEDGSDDEEYDGTIPEVVTDASVRKFRVRFTAKYYDSITSQSTLASELKGLEAKTNDDGWITYPVMYVVASGRGSYANDYSIRITQSTSYDQDYNMKVLCFSILNTSGTVTTDASYMGSLVDTSRYTEIIQIEDILDAVSKGVAPVYIAVDQDVIEAVYEAYKDYCLEMNATLEELYETKLAEYISDIADATGDDEDTVETILNYLLTGYYVYNSKTYSDYEEAYEYLTELQDLIDSTEEDEFIELDQFDPFTGTRLGETTMLPLFEIAQLWEGEEADYYALSMDDQNAYSLDANTVDFTSVLGVSLDCGSDGYFTNPEEREEGWTYEDELEWCYQCAFDGTTDARILTSKRIYVDAFFDANYPTTIKHALAELAIARNDAPCFLDTGIIESFSKWNRKLLTDEFSAYDESYIISKNLHHYYTRETSTNKKVQVTITHFLAQQFAFHSLKYGTYIPMVKRYCQLSGHVKDSLSPTIEDYQKTLKDELNKNRFNYFEVVSDNVYQRATQNTAQSVTSDLLEESNIHTLFELKRILEADCDAHLYDFLEEDVRTNFKDYEDAKFKDWIGTKLEAFDIRFECNEYEFNHSILHCYVDITFRGLIKYVTIEIDVNKRVYASSDEDE